MNDMPAHTEYNGVLLTDNVDMEWLKNLTPRYHPDMCKFVINTETTRVAVGMDVHADAEMLLENGKGAADLLGGNIFFEDGHIEYESTLNIPLNLDLKKRGKPRGFAKLFRRKEDSSANPRVITDKDTIEQMNAILFSWIKL